VNGKSGLSFTRQCDCSGKLDTDSLFDESIATFEDDGGAYNQKMPRVYQIKR
jgi:hypothetical protein